MVHRIYAAAEVPGAFMKTIDVAYLDAMPFLGWRSPVELFLSELGELSYAEDPIRELEAFFVGLTKLSTSRGAVRLQRVAIEEAERFIDIGEMLHREVVEQAQLKVNRYLEKLPNLAAPIGREADEDSRSELAILLLNMTTDPQRFERSLAR
jgi:hypothetical protein